MLVPSRHIERDRAQWPEAAEAGVTFVRAYLPRYAHYWVNLQRLPLPFLKRMGWPFPMPGWLKDGLRYAPLAALVAVVVPEIVMTPQGRLVGSWQDARLWAAVAASAYYFWRRGILGTIVSGTAVLLAARLGLGW